MRLALLLIPALAGCRGGDRPTPDTPTTGQIVIAADESFRPLVQAEIDVFQGLYRYARIQPQWRPESEAIRDLLEGKVRLAVVSRDFNDAEREALAREQIVPRSVRIAVDGVALITNRRNPDSLITTGGLERLFRGEARSWAELRPGASGEEVLIVFDGSGSSNLNFVLDRFGVTDVGGLRVYATKSNEEVIRYVEEHDNALGVIGAGWISDADDPSSQQFLRSVRVMGVAAGAQAAPEDHYQPYQAYLALEQYPLRRDVYVLSREPRAGLGTGFMSHLASDRGQRIVLKAGLLPVTMPVRLVETKETLDTF